VERRGYPIGGIIRYMPFAFEKLIVYQKAVTFADVVVRDKPQSSRRNPQADGNALIGEK